MSTVDWSAMSEALLRVERLGERESGLLSFGSSGSGGVFVAQGRVCFVGARGRGHRLRGQLPQGVAAGVEPLGSMPPGDLESALRRHSAECLLELCREPLPTRWASREHRGDVPRVSFRPVELLFEAAGLQFPELRARALGTLAQLRGVSRRAAAFVFDEAEQSLLPLAELGGQSVASLRALADLAAAFPRVSLELATEACFALATTSEGESVLVWWRDGLLLTVLCEDRATLATVAAQHLAEA